MKSIRVRATVLLAVAVVCCIGGYFLFFGGSAGGKPSAVRAAFPMPESNRRCAECHESAKHAEIYGQWESSYHGMAWTDPDVRGLSRDFATSKDCWPCHAPEPVFLTGIGASPTARSVRQLEGVGCITCHYTPDGTAAVRAVEGAWCKPVRKLDRATAIALCAGCHNQHKTVDEWKTSRFFNDPDSYKDCIDCHMPKVEGKSGKFSSHACRGGHDLEFLKTAATVNAWIDGGSVHAEVSNTGCGHNLPTDARHRAVDLVAEDPDAPEGSAPLFEARFRNPYRNEAGPNTQIKPGETVTRTAKVPAGTARVRVRLLYSLRPGNVAVSTALSMDKRVVLFEKTLDASVK